jgi:hypothetical protein
LNSRLRIEMSSFPGSHDDKHRAESVGSVLVMNKSAPMKDATLARHKAAFGLWFLVHQTLEDVVIRGRRSGTPFPRALDQRMRVLFFFLLASFGLATHSIHPAYAADLPPAGPPELVLRAGEAPTGLFGSVTFDATGTFVAVETFQRLIVFDLTWNTEVRRISFKSPASMRRTVFSHHRREAFVEDGDTILECALEGTQPCKAIAGNTFAGGAIAVSGDDRWLAYLDHQHIPTLLDLKNGTRVPIGGLGMDRDDLARVWGLAVFSSDSKFLAVARGRAEALIFRLEGRPHLDSRWPLFGTAVDLGFNAEQRLLACVLVPTLDASKAPDSFRVLNVTDRKMVVPETKGYSPQLVRNATAVVFKFNANPALPAQTDLQVLPFSSKRITTITHLVALSFRTYVSSDAKKAVYSDAASNAVFARDLGSAQPPTILIGAVSSVFDVDFIAGTDTLFAHDIGTRLWSLFAGVPTTVAAELEFSADGKLGAYFPLQHNETSQELWTFSVTVPVPDWVKKVIDEWTVPAGLISGPLFRAINKAGRTWGSGFTPKVIWSIVREGAASCGLAGLAPQDLRRTCARLCHQAGGELEQIQFLLGHISIETTERYLGCKQHFQNAVNDAVGLEPGGS